MDLVIIGFGELGQAFYRASNQTEKVRIVGYHDVIESNQQVALRFYPSFETLLKLEVDGYILTAPQDKQIDIALSLAKTGRKILFPLPLAISRDELEIILHAIPSDQLIIAPLSCYQKNILALKKHLGQKILGTLGVAEFSQVIHEQPQKWYQDISLSGGCRYQLLLQLLCKVFFLFGDSKASFGHYSCSGTSDYANCSLKLESGMLVALETSWGSKENNRETIELSGEKGNISLDSCETNPAILISEEKLNRYWDASSEGTAYNPIRLFLEDFVLGKYLVSPANLLEFQQVIDTCEIGMVTTHD